MKDFLITYADGGTYDIAADEEDNRLQVSCRPELFTRMRMAAGAADTTGWPVENRTGHLQLKRPELPFAECLLELCQASRRCSQR
jgi:hypothetical protein